MTAGDQTDAHDTAAQNTPLVLRAARSAGGSALSRGEVLVDRGQELLGGQPGLVRADQEREVLGPLALFDGLDAHALEGLGEGRHLGGAVELAAVLEATGPRIERGDRVGGGRLALLVLAEGPTHPD